LYVLIRTYRIGEETAEHRVEHYTPDGNTPVGELMLVCCKNNDQRRKAIE
jgi:hypothetical protein